MNDSDFKYNVLSGDIEVFDPIAEMSCPYPKALIPSASVIDAFYEGVWHTDHPDQSYSLNTRTILAKTLAGRQVCSYHFSRALVTVLVEMYSGLPGVEYQRFLPAFYEVTDVLSGDGGASAQWIENAKTWLETFLKAATGGYGSFMQLHEVSQNEILRLRRKVDPTRQI